MWFVLAAMAWAQDAAEVPVADPAELTGSGGSSGGASGGSSGGSSSKGGGSSRSDSGSSSGKGFKTGKIGKWKYQPYVMPGGGVTINGSDASVAAGVDAGVRYWRKNWEGDLHAGGSYTTGDGLNGYEVHAGNDFGRREKYWGLSAGLELLYSGYTYDDLSVAMAPAGGIGIPVEVTLGPKKYYAYGGMMPAWYTDRQRQVNWNQVDAIGFGDEFEWFAGAGAKLSWINGEVGITQTVTVAGVVTTPTISVSIAGMD